MKMQFKKQLERNISYTRPLKEYRGTIVLDNGALLHLTPDYLKLENYNTDNLSPVVEYTRVKSETRTKKGKIIPSRVLYIRVYSIEILGFNLLFEKVNDEDILRTFSYDGFRYKIPNSNLYETFRKLHVYISKATFETYINDDELEFKVNKPKKKGNLINLKLTKKPVEIEIELANRKG